MLAVWTEWSEKTEEMCLLLLVVGLFESRVSWEREKFCLGTDKYGFIYTISVLFSALSSPDRHAQFTHDVWWGSPCQSLIANNRHLGAAIRRVLRLTSCGKYRVRLTNGNTC